MRILGQPTSWCCWIARLPLQFGVFDKVRGVVTRGAFAPWSTMCPVAHECVALSFILFAMLVARGYGGLQSNVFGKKMGSLACRGASANKGDM